MIRSTCRRGVTAVLPILCAALAACKQDAPRTDVPAASPSSSQGVDAARAAIAMTPDDRQRAGIRTDILRSALQGDLLEVTATVRANQDRVARIAPRVEGRITAVRAKLGDAVRAGQPLASLDSFSVGEAQSALLQAEAAQRVAQADFKRIDALNAEEVIARKDVLRARAELERSAAEVRAAQGRLRLLGAAAGGADRASSTFPVVAPFAGTVIQRNAAVGDLASPALPLFTVVDLSTVWVEANLPETLLAKIQSGASATVSVAAYPQQRFAGRVTHLANVLDKDTRSVVARIEVPNPDGRLKPEMFGTARIDSGAAATRVLSVPDEAIVLLQGMPTVFVAGPGGFDPRPIEPGKTAGGRTLVTSGLREGDELVVAGAYALKARLLKSQISDAD